MCKTSDIKVLQVYDEEIFNVTAFNLKKDVVRGLTLIGLLSALRSIVHLPIASADNLKDLLESEPYRKVAGGLDRAPENGKKKLVGNPEEVEAHTNYDLLWRTMRPGILLLDWIGVRNTRARVAVSIVTPHAEYAQAHATLSNREKVVVDLTIRVPRPEFLTMAEYRTLSGFNKFRPPALDITADQVIPLHGMEASYYRHRDGACSLLFEISKHSIVNLYTKNCADSRVMMDFAKGLDFKRLSSKLDS